ncbi:MAG: cupredoxin family copper-binding protein [Geminicoccaceae bacterium]
MKAALLALAATVLAMAPAMATPPPVTVAIANFTFEPATLTVPAGTTVTWVNRDDIPHLVDAGDGSFASPPLDTDDSFSFTLTAPGDVAYFCGLHPHMTGTIRVVAGSG